MIQLVSKILATNIQQKLDDLQSKIDSKKTFLDKTTKAQSLWTSKGGDAGKIAFENIKKELYNLCIYEGICNYCEQSEANDIEHIYPKSFFPEMTFKWQNYLLACKQCNSGHKLDKCHILDNDSNLIFVPRGEEPKFKKGAFINPRIEDPNKFMILNMRTYKFMHLPDLNKEEKNKAESTWEILELNTRDTLIATRKSAAKYYYERMDRLIKILSCNTIMEFQEILTPYDNLFDLNKDLDILKLEIKESHKIEISSYQHPSVWHSIKEIESKVNIKWQTIFNKLPEALNW